MKIAIVGGTGNISSAIVRRLLELGHDVTCCNRQQRGADQTNVRTIQCDRQADRAAFEQAMQAERFDAAIDMICFNAEDAQSSLRAFRGVGQFVMCSTVCTYGFHCDQLPTTEDHPLRPSDDYGRNKIAADNVFLAAHAEEGFPATIIKPSTTYGPLGGLVRQVAHEFSWIDRVRKAKPIVVCGDGNAIHQFLHVDDAALCFAGVLGKPACIGQVYNMMRRECMTWVDYHRTAMKVIGREVELVGVPYADLAKCNIPRFDLCETVFRYHGYFSPEKLFREVPEFRPRVTLEQGMMQVLAAMDADGRVPNSDAVQWEDAVIARQRRVGQA